MDINKYLDVDEKVIWSDRPVYGAFLLQSLIPITILGLPFLLFVILFNYLTVYTGALIGLVITIPTLLMWGLIFGLPIYLVLSRKGYPTYFFTSKQRGIILSEMGGFKTPLSPLVAIFSTKNITQTGVTQNIIERLFGPDVRTVWFKIGLSNQIRVSQNDVASGVTLGNLRVTIPNNDSELTTAAYTQGRTLTLNGISNSATALQIMKS